MREQAIARRLAASSPREREALTPLLQQHRSTTENLLLTADADHDDLEHAARTLSRLCKNFGSTVDRFQNLAVAVSLVHDSKARLTRSINGIPTRSPDPEAIFAFFASRMSQGQMRSDLPPELLAYVVDPTVDEQQLRWAAASYARTPAARNIYGEVPYDNEYFRGGRRAMASHRYTLANVRQYSGVCADRSFFAANVAKSIGIPSAGVRGIRPEVTHAWVAQLDLQTGKWHEFGRSSRYKKVSGQIVSPQTRALLNEDELRALARMLQVSPEDRLEALALVHLARSTRQADLRMIRLALEINPACLPAWQLLQRHANQLSDDQISDWQTFVKHHCPRSFATRMLLELASAISHPQRRQSTYEELYLAVANNDDLACEIRFRQAVDLAGHGETKKALELCRDAAVKHWTSGQGALLLANTARDIAVRDSARDQLLEVYAAMFGSFPSPKTSAQQFTEHTAWRLVGEDYAKSLREHGRETEAQTVLEKIGAGT